MGDSKISILGAFVVLGFRATDPAAIVELDKCDRARVLGQVKSQARHFLWSQGTMVAPSGLRASPGQQPPKLKDRGNTSDPQGERECVVDEGMSDLPPRALPAR